MENKGGEGEGQTRFKKIRKVVLKKMARSEREDTIIDPHLPFFCSCTLYRANKYRNILYLNKVVYSVPANVHGGI